jgi:hypothetical protein
MGTRAIYTFDDEWGQHFVYKHWDNDPKSAAEFIRNALKQSWKLPRFEADEFAAVFISANKKEAGDIRLVHSQDAVGDLAFRYEISCKEEKLYVKAFSCKDLNLIFDGFLEDFEESYIST